jgi:hypothetical protein
MSNPEKPRLIPAQVPWQVAPSTPLLRLYATDYEDTIVKFAGHFGLEHPKDDTEVSGVGSEIVAVVSADGLDKAVPGDRRAPYKVIKAAFRSSPWSRMSPAISDSKTIDEELYDWSAVTGYSPSSESFDAWSQRYDETWLRTGICPDPNFYEVEHSAWLAETGAARYGMKHFLITGEDSYIEVIAADWTWEVEGILEGW